MAGREELDSFKRATENKVHGLRCPTHRRRPEVCFSGTSLRDVSIRMSGCCARLMELANAAIAGRAPAGHGKSSAQEAT
ncbi:MAG TPA: hypothetical protein VFA04_16220 [Bryobacteraceae bacterium]|jgi:hypothetical protein|nr:hypothetical protein [Bryobacteraceae bacterium]